MYSDNNYINKKDDHQERLKKIFYYLKENISSQDIKITQSISVLLRKLYKYLKENANYLSLSFDPTAEEKIINKTSLIFIDETFIEIKQNIKDWMKLFFSYLNNRFTEQKGNDNDSSLDYMMLNNSKLYLYIITTFIVLKEICYSPPFEQIQMISDINFYYNRFLLYELCEYYIILNQKKFFINNYKLIFNLYRLICKSN